MDDSECFAEFIVKKRDLPDLAAALQIPNQFVCHRHQRSVADGMEGLCMLLRRLSYPCRYSDTISALQCEVIFAVKQKKYQIFANKIQI